MYRVVKISWKHKSEVRYRVEKKVLFWWNPVQRLDGKWDFDSLDEADEFARFLVLREYNKRQTPIESIVSTYKEIDHV